MYSNADTCCLGKKIIVMVMTESTANVYPYYTSYEPMYNVPIVTGASTYTNINTRRSFIIVINEALYYGEKLSHYLINLNKLWSYGTMVWDNPFDSNRKLWVETEDGDTIDIINNGTNVGLDSRAPTEHEFQSLPHVQLTSKFQWNPDMVQLGEVRAGTFKAKYIAWHCKYLGDT